MDPCNCKSDQFVSLYLFDNGKPCNPERLRVRRSEVDKHFSKSDKLFYYKSKALYTMEGRPVLNFEKMGDCDSMGFVIMIPHEAFIKCNYKEAFDGILEKRKELQRKSELKSQRCNSTPSVPYSSKSSMQRRCGDDEKPKKLPSKSKMLKSCEDSMRRRSRDDEICSSNSKTSKSNVKEHQHCVTKDKYPCCDEDSDLFDSDEEVKAKPKKESKSKESLKQAKPAKTKEPKRESICESFDPYGCKPRKRGIFSKCCPCCVKRPISRPAFESIEESRPGSRACGVNSKKMTQTCPEDFKRAIKCYKAMQKEEKRRQKLYGKNMKRPEGMSCADEREKLNSNGIDECITDQDKAKKEIAYRKARQQYRQKRKKMEEKLTKLLEKELKKDNKGCS